MGLRNCLKDRGHWCGALNLTRHRSEPTEDLFYPSSAMEVMGLLRRLDYDVVHLHVGGTFQPRLTLLALVASALPGSRSVFTFHSGGYPSSPEGRATTPKSLRAFALRRFDACVAVNPEILAWFGQCGVDEARAHLIYPHSIPELSGGALRADVESFFDTHTRVLTTVGLLEPEYDLSLQIRSMEELRTAHPELGLLIVGSGSLEEALRREIEESPHAEHILLAGDVDHQDTLSAIRRSAAFLRTTHYDGDSISVREALHMGVPVIASENGMRPEGCVLFPPKDQRAFEHEVLALLAGSGSEPTTDTAVTDETSNLEAVVQLYEALL